MRFTEYERRSKGWEGVLALFFAVVLPLALLGHVADEVHEGETLALDSAFLNALHQRFSSPPLDHFFVAVAHWGGFYGLLPLSLILIILLGTLRRRGDALFLLTSVVGASIINLASKHLFGRARPALWLSPAPQTDFGFPSGHAMLSTAFFVALMILAWPTRWRLFTLLSGIFFIAVICFSRLYLGVHYPTDVVGGILASLIWVNGLHRLRRLLRW